MCGFGHIARCLSICQHFEELGVAAEFIIEGDNSVSSMLEGRSFVLMNWLNNEDILQKLQESAFVLIDSLRITKNQVKSIQELDAHIIYIDDDKRENTLDKGFVLDWTVLSDKKRHFLPRKKGVVYLLGSRYTPFREPFRGVNKINIQEKLQSVFISFGGSDVRNLTPRVLEALKQYFPNLQKKVVIGSGCKSIDSIESLQDDSTTLVYSANAKQMSFLMQESDIAISSGGQTLYELACLGIPTIAILLVENARGDTEGWSEVGAIDYIGHFDDKGLMQKLIQSMGVLESQKMRQAMQLAGTPFIDSNGGSLIVNTVINGAK